MKHLLLIVFTFLFLKPLYQSTTCGSGTFYFELTDSCENCSEGCSVCTGFHESKCKSCKPEFNTINIDNQFYCSQCAKGEYYDTSLATCTSCKFDCDLCFESTTCLICKVGYLLDPLYTQCDTTACDFGYYRDTVSTHCLQCPPSMDQCAQQQSPSSGVYPIKCSNNLRLINSQCLCQYASYLSGNSCQSCTDANCVSCSGSNQCSLCRDGYYLQGSQCVVICDQTLYYIVQTYPYQYECNLYSSQTTAFRYQITQINGSYYCNNYIGYVNGYGCFSKCRPLEFKLYNPERNSYTCVKQCPSNYTLDYDYLTCISNDCTNDLTYPKDGTCFYRVCPLGTFFQSFISHTQKSVCTANLSNCIDQCDENSSCQQCQPGYVFDSNSRMCIIGCTNNNYFSGNACQTCEYNGSTQAQIQACLDQNRQFSYLYGGVTYYGSTSCPEGYYLQGTECKQCSDPSLIICTTDKKQYVCELGMNNTVQTCDPLDLPSLMPNNKGLDQEGSVIAIASSRCKVLNGDGTCKICDSQQNFNFKGVCSKQFGRATKFYYYYNKTDSQYQVLDSCTSTQYVSRYASCKLRQCKQFAYCLHYNKEVIDGVEVNLCTSCPQFFYNLNGNCIENCPNYTYKNFDKQTCETPIAYCAVYYNPPRSAPPRCIQCRNSYATYLNGSQCILISDCNSGIYYNVAQNVCLPCVTGCSSCDWTGKCLQASNGYWLLNYDPVTNCPSGYFTNTTNQKCEKCSQFCLTCIDAQTCTSPYNGLQYYYLVINKVYYYILPICKDNEYFDSVLKQCFPCHSSCSKCFFKNNSSICVLCNNTNQSLFQDQCVNKCPDGYYQSAWNTANLDRYICNKTCKPGQSLFQNKCLDNSCPIGYFGKVVFI